jgi:hypothetical protein
VAAACSPASGSPKVTSWSVASWLIVEYRCSYHQRIWRRRSGGLRTPIIVIRIVPHRHRCKYREIGFFWYYGDALCLPASNSDRPAFALSLIGVPKYQWYFLYRTQKEWSKKLVRWYILRFCLATPHMRCNRNFR